MRNSKTDGGAGRLVPLTKRACAGLGPWLERFGSASSSTFLFPFHRVAIAGNRRRSLIYDVRLERPMSMSSYKHAFKTARKKAGVECRFYDARHTFITRLAENPAVSEETIRQLAGHVNPKMLRRYAHIRVAARRAAIATLEQGSLNSERIDPPQNPPQFLPSAREQSEGSVEKSTSDQGLRTGSPGRIRTSDPTVNSRLLYRLSYRGASLRGRPEVISLIVNQVSRDTLGVARWTKLEAGRTVPSQEPSCFKTLFVTSDWCRRRGLGVSLGVLRATARNLESRAASCVLRR